MCCAEPIKDKEWWRDIRAGTRSVTFLSEEEALAFLALGQKGVEPELQILYEAVRSKHEQLANGLKAKEQRGE